jgi:hypothetical protein
MDELYVRNVQFGSSILASKCDEFFREETRRIIGNPDQTVDMQLL